MGSLLHLSTLVSGKVNLPHDKMKDNSLFENEILFTLGKNTGCPRMFYTQKCKNLRIFITIKTIELWYFD